MATDRYADCEACGERYWGDDILAYMREVHLPGDEWCWLCKSHSSETKGEG